MYHYYSSCNSRGHIYENSPLLPYITGLDISPMAPETPSPEPQYALLLNKPSPPKSREKLPAAFPSKCVITHRPSFSVDCGCWQKPTQHTVEPKCLQRTHSTFLSFLFFYANIFPFLSSPCSPSVNITREQALENRTELFLKGQSCKWPKTFFVNGWGEGRLGACGVSTVRNTWPGGVG